MIKLRVNGKEETEKKYLNEMKNFSLILLDSVRSTHTHTQNNDDIFHSYHISFHFDYHFFFVFTVFFQFSRWPKRMNE